MPKTEPPRVKSLGRALAILDILGQKGCERSLGEIAQLAKLPPSTVHRLLSSLQQRGFVVQDKTTSNYALGENLILLGRKAEMQRDVRMIARPALEQLARTTRETVNLTTLVGNSVVQLDHVDSPNILKVTWDSGQQFPVYASASGKVFLAYLTEDERQRMFRSLKPHAFTKRTIVNAKKSRTEFELIRRRGYAIDDAEREEGVRCVAAPIFNSRGRVIAAVSVSGPSLRLALAKLEKLAKPLLETASAISTLLGHGVERSAA
jgi:DNA-binding IclR family transcriptional regulator